MRTSYGRAATAVLQLERSEAALMGELADLDDAAVAVGDGSTERRVVSFPDKTTRTEDIRREIDTALDELDDPAKWQEWLEFSQRFHRYSLNNQMLIYMQKPDATRVAGFHKWKELGRSVNKGEKAIWIYAPMVKKIQVEDESGNAKRESRVVGFKVVPVFDVSSTSGEPVPEPPVSPISHLEGRAPDGMHEDLDAQIEGHGYRVEYRDLGEGPHAAGGYTDPATNTVTINSRAGHAHQAKTKAHELAHIELGHTDRTSEYHTGAGGQRSTMEVEAESVSYVVSRRYGLSSPGDWSFSYIQGWARGDREKVRRTAETVVKATDRIMGRINRFQV